MAYEPLHHKYRPQTFADLVGQTAIAATLSNAIAQERIAPAYLFTGPRGTGKTSSARILAKSLNCIAGDRPTASPCGECETCRSITNGSALDVIEIDAASNTGVDNIREIIERAQFAPVQCRFKVYVIDECLTGDSQILTRNGLMSIDNPQIKGQEALSYNENLQRWEYKKVLRWLDRGEKQILIIKTKNSTIRCTGNHLIRTEQGWTKAKEITQGMKILSPVNVDAVQPSKNTALTVKSGGLSVAINYEGINTDRKNTISQPFSKRQKPQVPYVYADVVKNSIFQYFCGVKEEELKASNPIGKDIPTKKAMDFGISELKKLQQVQNPWGQKSLVLSTEHYLGTEVSIILTKTADFPACDGLMAVSSPNGWNTKPNNCNVYPLKYASQQTRVMGKVPFAVKPVAIQTSSKFLTQSNRAVRESKFLGNGSQALPQKAWPGGIWMTAPFPSLSLEAHQFNYTPKDSPQKKTKLLPSGSVTWDIRPVPNLTEEVLTEKPITTQKWEQLPPENGCQIYESIQSPQWNTNFEEVESITKGIVEKVYDLEVEDNHNFVANGLLVHNCHMLSTAAFNALLKTLEEPPERVVFVLATTDPQRVLPTIISRCQRFDYRRIALDGMVAHLRYIADQESINIDQSALTLVAQISNGGLRDAESLLDQLSLLPDLITPDKVWDLVGAVPEQDLLMLLTAIASNDSETLLGTCRQILDRGREPLVVLQNLAAFYLNLLIAQTAPQRSDLVAVTTETWQELCRIAPQWQTGVILQGQQKLKESEFQIRNTTQPRLWLEVTLLGLLPSACVTLVPVNSGNPSGVNPSIAPPPKPSNLLTFPGSNHLTVVDNPIPQRETESDQKINKVSSEQNFVEETIEENITTFAPSNINLEQTWAEALNKLGALSQSLFKTYGSLVKLGPGSATVSVTTQQLLNIAAGKKGELETALGQACGHAVKVNLVVGKQSLTGKVESPIPTSPAIHSRAPAIPSESIPDRQTDQNNQINRPLAPNPIDQVQQVPPTESTKQAPPARAQSSPQTIAHSAANSEIKPSPRRETSTGSRPKPQVKPSSGPEENLLEEIPEGETRKAIEQFAKNFSGQIVASEVEPQDLAPDLDQEKELVNPRKSSPPEETSHPIILNRPAIELDDEDDLPF